MENEMHNSLILSYPILFLFVPTEKLHFARVSSSLDTRARPNYAISPTCTNPTHAGQC